VSRILLADDSPHAQRMGERILREEGYEVVSITDGQTALLRLRDVDPDLVLADVFLPLKSGFDVSRYVKSHPEHRHARVVLTAGLLEPFDEQEALLAGCDAILKKPFEASAMLETVKRLIAEAQVARGERSEMAPTAETIAPVETITPVQTIAPPVAPAPEVDPERVRAAVTLALDASMPAMIEEITQRVLVALGL
jgi:PleD family two-component response regulator